MPTATVPHNAITEELRTRFRALLWTWRVRVDREEAEYPMTPRPTRYDGAFPIDATAELTDAEQDGFWAALGAAIGDGLTFTPPPSDQALEDDCGEQYYQYRYERLDSALDTLTLHGRTNFERLASDLAWAVSQQLPARWARDVRATAPLAGKARTLRARLERDRRALLALHRGDDADHTCAVCAAYDALLCALPHELACDPLFASARRDRGRPAEAWRGELLRRLHPNGVAARSDAERDLLQAIGLRPVTTD